MSKQNILAQVYGYAVCLVTLIIIVFSIPSLVKSMFSLSDVKHSTNYATMYVSFENYKNEYITLQNKISTREQGEKDKVKINIPDDQSLLKMYEAEKADKFDKTFFQIKRRFFSTLVLTFVALILFILHWKWVRKYVSNEQ